MGIIYSENLSDSLDISQSWVDAGGPFTKSATVTDTSTPAVAFHRVLTESLSSSLSFTAVEKGGHHIQQSVTVTDVISLLSQNPVQEISISDVVAQNLVYKRTVTDSSTIVDFFRGLILRGDVYVEAEGSETFTAYSQGTLQSGDELQF